ncbi:hypothetical protein B4N89_41210 [Embleya scabrispora]|uniref:Uncharacterized protein n=1 Tax=Embleya scabrispora TaxID=159449 RepID=A0A1T3NJW3_9ACTN|nr:hypothetical protein [Embleya scabrispora]OPC77005.1 hypothetical protein B4N89_41210 [Embleya scabrispora]
MTSWYSWTNGTGASRWRVAYKGSGTGKLAMPALANRYRELDDGSDKWFYSRQEPAVGHLAIGTEPTYNDHCEEYRHRFYQGLRSEHRFSGQVGSKLGGVGAIR